MYVGIGSDKKILSQSDTLAWLFRKIIASDKYSGFNRLWVAV